MLSAGTLISQIEDPAWVKSVGIALIAVGGAIIGVQAKDRKGGE